jgi:ribonuclease Z
MNMWLLGRKQPLNIYGLSETIDRLTAMMELFEWGTWPNFYPVAQHRIDEEEMAQVLANDDLRIFASPVCHLVPTMGLRIETLRGGRVLTYSCDTEPCPAVIDLAHDADYLIHESTGAFHGHSTARQAGEIARQSGAKALYLIHYPTGGFDTKPLIKEAQQAFDGPVHLAEDFLKIELRE